MASIALPSFVANGKYNFQKLHDVAKVITVNLNRIIDRNYYPVETARRSNMRHRPIGLGVNGLADAFMSLRLPFESAEARQLNKQIFETIYHAALEASSDLAEVEGPYETYEGSPASKGILQYDMWGVTPSDLWDWTALKEKIARTGLRNSLLLAPMPTASTSQILGFNECFEPYTSNIYHRRVLAGEFQVVCPWLLRELVDLQLWNDEMKNMIIANNGSIQSIEGIPDDVKAIYKTVWDISQKKVIDMAADRGAFICQSQSLNIHLQSPTMGQLTSMHFYGWKKGLKTGMYYLRTRPAAQAIQFTVDQTMLKNSLAAKTAKVNGTMSKKSMNHANGSSYSFTPIPIKREPTSPDLSSLTSPITSSPALSENDAVAESAGEKLEVLSLDERTRQAAERDPEFAAALQRQRERELEQAKLACSLENKEACLMCSA